MRRPRVSRRELSGMARPKGRKPSVRLSVSVSATDHAELARFAEARDLSLAWVVRRAISDFVERHRDDVQAEARVLLSSSALSRRSASASGWQRARYRSRVSRAEHCELAVDKRLTPTIAFLGNRPVKVAAMAPILTAEDVVRRIAAECAHVDERGAVVARAGAAEIVPRLNYSAGSSMIS
jgi:hypothetical protein